MSKEVLFKISRSGKVIAQKAGLADSFRLRALGLMFSDNLGSKDALIIEPCRSIHTCFMNYPIDVIFLSSEDKVVKVFRELKPWRMTRIYFTATKVVELMGGTLKEDIPLGEKLEIRCIS